MASVKLLLILCLGALTSAAPTAHVVFIIGQSNSVGVNSDGHTAEDVTYPNILQTSCCSDGSANNDQCQLISGQDPLHHQCDDAYLNSNWVGFGMSFARELRAEIPADDIIVLVPAGIGGTGFVDGVWSAYVGSGFQQAVKRLSNTFPLLAQKYPNHTASLDGILWHQGEADADVNVTTAQYMNDDIIPMINAFRNSSLIPQSNENVPFVLGNLLPAWVTDPAQTQRLGVFVALQVLDQYVPYTMVTPSQGLVGDASEGATPIHFSAKSQRIFGKRYFAAWKVALLDFNL